jgi:hypothetical protein
VNVLDNVSNRTQRTLEGTQCSSMHGKSLVWISNTTDHNCTIRTPQLCLGVTTTRMIHYSVKSHDDLSGNMVAFGVVLSRWRLGFASWLCGSWCTGGCWQADTSLSSAASAPADACIFQHSLCASL